MTDYQPMTNGELVSAYNAMVEAAGVRGIEVTPVKKFKDHSIGVERCRKLEERLARHDGLRSSDGTSEKSEEQRTTEAEAAPAEAEPSTGHEPERESEDMAAKKKATKKKTTAKKATKAKVAKVAKPKFGHDKVIIEVGACNRFKGSKAEKLYGQMARYMEKHPKATVAEVLAETDYRRQDFQWDLDRKTIKVRSA